MKEKTLQEKLRIKSGMIFMGEKIEFGSECALMDCAADYIDILQKQLKEKEKDAERLRLLMTMSGEMYQESIKFQFVGRLKEFIDANKAAIDAAMKESE